MDVFYEQHCAKCGEVFKTPADERAYECPRCGGDILKNYAFRRCDDCGGIVWLSGFTNECGACGAFYNGFGQKLSPPEEWDPEDRYDSFGPQEENW